MKRLMSRSDVVIAVWGLILLIIWIPSWAVWRPDPETTIFLSVAIVVTLAKAAWATLRARQVPEPGDRRPAAVVGTTHATSLMGIAIVCAAIGVELGLWLVFLGAGLFLVALGGLWREQRAARRTLAGAPPREPVPPAGGGPRA